MNKLKKISIMLLGVLIIGTTISLAGSGTSNTDELRVRKEASTTSEILTYLYKGNEVEIIEKSGDWYKIKYQAIEGYVRGDLIDVKDEAIVEKTTEDIKPTEEAAIPETTEVKYPIDNITKANTKVYILPVITSSTILNIEQGKTITIKKVINNWSYISYENKLGWVRNYILNTTNSAAEVTTTTTAIEEPASIQNGYINVSSANLRETASTSAKILTTLTLNTKVTISGQETDWYKVEYGEYKGYISKKLISEQATVTTRSQTEKRNIETKTGYINVNIANVRSEAATNSKIITTLKQKTQIEILEEQGDFYKININNTVGYIAKRLVVNDLSKIIETKPVATKTETTSPITATSVAPIKEVSSSKGLEVVNLAKKYLGYSYVSGGTTPEKGFDCTGFTYYIYNQCGYKLARLISAQANSGVAVERADLQPGDLLIFNNGSNGSLGHTGIYIGERQIYTCGKFK